MHVDSDLEHWKRNRTSLPSDLTKFLHDHVEVRLKSGWEDYLAGSKKSKKKSGRWAHHRQFYVCHLNKNPDHQHLLQLIAAHSTATDDPSAFIDPNRDHPMPEADSVDAISGPEASSASAASSSSSTPAAPMHDSAGSHPNPFEQQPRPSSGHANPPDTSSHSSSSSPPSNKAYTNWETCPIEDLLFCLKFEERYQHASAGGHPMTLSKAGAYFDSYHLANGDMNSMLSACRQANAAAATAAAA